jgi:hypothetical protein
MILQESKVRSTIGSRRDQQLKIKMKAVSQFGLQLVFLGGLFDLWANPT